MLITGGKRPPLLLNVYECAPAQAFGFVSKNITKAFKQHVLARVELPARGKPQNGKCIEVVERTEE